jgi:hypothetical protein
MSGGISSNMHTFLSSMQRLCHCVCVIAYIYSSSVGISELRIMTTVYALVAQFWSGTVQVPTAITTSVTGLAVPVPIAVQGSGWQKQIRQSSKITVAVANRFVVGLPW